MDTTIPVTNDPKNDALLEIANIEVLSIERIVGMPDNYRLILIDGTEVIALIQSIKAPEERIAAIDRTIAIKMEEIAKAEEERTMVAAYMSNEGGESDE